MPGKKFHYSEKIRLWVKYAVDAGCDSPKSVQEYIDKHSTDINPPSIPTIGNVMKEMGYEPAGYKWEKKDKK